MPLINCEISIMLTWPKCFLVAGTAANQEPTFTITDTKFGTKPIFGFFNWSVSTVSGYVSISVFALLAGTLVSTTTSAVGLKIGVVIAGFKKYKSLI